MASKKRNFVTQKVIAECERVSEKKIEEEEVDALHIKTEAYNHFLSMVHQNNPTLISSYAQQLLAHYDLLSELT